MVFEYKDIIKKDGFFKIDEKVHAKVNAVLDKAILKDFWNGYTFHRSTISMEHTSEINFCIGNPKKILTGEYSYAINIDSNGIFVTASSEKNLIYGFMALLDCINADENGCLKADCCEIYDSPAVDRRMIHYCIFPGTELWEFQRFVRLCGALKYSHIVVEFWGTLKYDCLPELCWENGFEKDMIRPVIKEANDLGIEIIPMFNHWGHASMSPVMKGKHTVLDQNPKLHYLFSDDGWCWNIKNAKTRLLMKNIRAEFTELCGKGGYFHIGCDEAYGFGYTEEEMDGVCDFINEINSEIEKSGRKTIMWADMLLHNGESYNKNNLYTAAAPSESASQYITKHLNKNIITADWQYESKYAPIETAVALKNAGFETLVCSWDRSMENCKACVKTAIEHNLSGVLHTTWNTLSSGTWYVTEVAYECWGGKTRKPNGILPTQTASVMRKVYFVDKDYKKAGWGDMVQE